MGLGISSSYTWQHPTPSRRPNYFRPRVNPHLNLIHHHEEQYYEIKLCGDRSHPYYLHVRIPIIPVRSECGRCQLYPDKCKIM